jgi:hypothetical protein
MTKKSRRILFYLGVIAFFVASTIAILDAQGYKYSFDQAKFLRTGAISLHTNTDADVYIDGKRKGSTSFFGSAFGADGLLPGIYDVRLLRDGYSTWEKSVTVQEGLVTDFPHALILPTDNPEEVTKIIIDIESIFRDANIALNTTATPTPKPKKTPVSKLSPSPSPSPTPAREEPFYIKNGTLYALVDGKPTMVDDRVEGFMIASGGRKILWWRSNELWVMYLSDADYQPYQKAGSRDMIVRLATPILHAAWYHGEDHVVLDSAGYKIIEIDKRGGTNIIKL